MPVMEGVGVMESVNEEISTMKDEIEKVKQRLDVSDKYKKKD